MNNNFIFEDREKASNHNQLRKSRSSLLPVALVGLSLVFIFIFSISLASAFIVNYDNSSGGTTLICVNGTAGNNISCVGPTGPQGPAGIDGINGTNGIDGINGTNGINGINGTNGIDGINGTNGIDGINGTDANYSLIVLNNQSGSINGNLTVDNFFGNINWSYILNIPSNVINAITSWLVPDTTNGYLYNDSTKIYFNDTKLNQTIPIVLDNSTIARTGNCLII